MHVRRGREAMVVVRELGGRLTAEPALLSLFLLLFAIPVRGSNLLPPFVVPLLLLVAYARPLRQLEGMLVAPRQVGNVRYSRPGQRQLFQRCPRPPASAGAGVERRAPRNATAAAAAVAAALLTLSPWSGLARTLAGAIPNRRKPAGVVRDRSEGVGLSTPHGSFA